jgi:hypothetical protein
MPLRLVPFVESNYNLVELGPRQTGKTYMYKNTSQRAFVVSSGKASAATLFHHGTTKKVGLIGVTDVVVFDEVASERANAQKLSDATIDTLKNYMAQGSFSKDGIEFTSTCPIVLGGNIDTRLEDRAPAHKYRHLFQPLPEETREDTAFLDRIHAYLPGWEMPVITPSNYATGYGFISDYVAEIFHLLRRRNYQTHIVAGARFPAGMSQRAHDAIKKTAAGLLKLIYPHRTPDEARRTELLFVPGDRNAAKSSGSIENYRAPGISESQLGISNLAPVSTQPISFFQAMKTASPMQRPAADFCSCCEPASPFTGDYERKGRISWSSPMAGKRGTSVECGSECGSKRKREPLWFP